MGATNDAYKLTPSVLRTQNLKESGVDGVHACTGPTPASGANDPSSSTVLSSSGSAAGASVAHFGVTDTVSPPSLVSSRVTSKIAGSRLGAVKSVSGITETGNEKVTGKRSLTPSQSGNSAPFTASVAEMMEGLVLITERDLDMKANACTPALLVSATIKDRSNVITPVAQFC